MRHCKRGRKLNRTSSHRKAMVRNLVTSLFEHGRVITSPAKAKEARPVAERLITMAKGGTLAHRRRAIAALNDKRVVSHLFDEIGPRYAARPGGYTRILHLDRTRLGDGGDQCLFELVEEEMKKKGKRQRARARVQTSAESTEPPAFAAEADGDGGSTGEESAPIDEAGDTQPDASGEDATPKALDETSPEGPEGQEDAAGVADESEEEPEKGA